MKNGSIDKRMLAEVRKIMESREEMKDWMELLKAEEPALYYWILRETDAVVNRTGDTYDNNLYVVSWKTDIIKAVRYVFLSAWIILKKAEERRLSQLVMTPEAEFERWLEGKLPSRYYDYDIEKLSKNDYRYIAKAAHTARMNIYKIKMQKKKEQLEIFRKIKDKADNSEQKQRDLQ